MNEQALRQILQRLAIRPGRTNSRGWIEFSCPLAPYTHTSGTDSRASAAARIAEGGISSFVCKGCHQHGRIGKLINLLATYRSNDALRSLILVADQADAQGVMDAGFGDFEQPLEIEPEPEPLVEEQFAGVYPRASTIPEAAAYMEERGIAPEGADAVGLLYDPQQRRIMFEVRDRRGRLYGFSGRAIDPGVQPKIRDYYGLPKRHMVLGEHRWVHGKPLVLVEGLFGYASLIAVGAETMANVGAILGSALTPEKAARIIDFDEPTYLMLDNDAGGDIGLFGTIRPDGSREDNGAIAALVEHVPLYVPDWPEDKADPDELTLDDLCVILRGSPLYCGIGTNPFDKRYEAWQ